MNQKESQDVGCAFLILVFAAVACFGYWVDRAYSPPPKPTAEAKP